MNKSTLDAYREIITNELYARNLHLTGSCTIGGNLNVSGSIGFTTYYGYAIITPGSQYVDVTHGLGLTPSVGRIHITPTSDFGGIWWINTTGSSTFRLNINSIDFENNIIFGWSYL